MVLERIGDILNRQQGLSRQEVSEEGTKPERKTHVETEDEARALGLNINHPQPPDERCEFCGKVLHHEGVFFMNTVVAWSPTAQRCDCPQAVEKWKAYDAEQERLKLEEERRKRFQKEQERIDRLLKKSGISRRFQQRVFENFITDTPGRKEAYKVAKAYADNFDRHLEDGTGLYIEGTNGTGKTHIAAAIAMQLMTQRQRTVICKTSGDMMLDIKSAFDDESRTEAQILDVYKKVDLLIVDDLGKEQCTDWSISTLYSIINDRYEGMRPTIITTNYNSDDIVRALTPKGYDNLKAVAIISRLREVSEVLTMAWKDYRTGR